jgi:hypothetical protein
LSHAIAPPSSFSFCCQSQLFARMREITQTIRERLIEMKKSYLFKLTICIFLATIPSEFTDCFGPYSPDAAAAAAMHYQFSGGYPTTPHGKHKEL